VVVAEQVQDAVGRQQVELLSGRVPGRSRLLRGHRGAQDDVAEQAGLRVLIVGAGAQLVHRERQDVGRPLLVHPLLVQGGHGGDVDREHGQLGLRVHPEPVEHEPGQRGDPLGVDALTGLVVDLDAHRGHRRRRPEPPEPLRGPVPRPDCSSWSASQRP